MANILEQLNLPAPAPLDLKTVTADRTLVEANLVYNGLVLYDSNGEGGVFVYTGTSGTNEAANWVAVGSGTGGSLTLQEEGTLVGNEAVEVINVVGPNTETTQTDDSNEATLTVNTAELIATQAEFDALAAAGSLVDGRYYEIADVPADADVIPAESLPVIAVDMGGTGATTAAEARTNLGITAGEATTYQNIGGDIPTWNQDTTGVAATVTNQGNLATQDDLSTAQVTALNIPEPISATNQVDYATELANVPTEFTPSAHTHVLADVTDSGALAALNNIDYTGDIITNKPFTHATEAEFDSAVDTRITTIGDVESYAGMAEFISDLTTVWHHGDVAILLDTSIAYLYTGTEGATSPSLTNDFHQITSTETLVSLGITASLTDINQLMGITLGTAAQQDIIAFEPPISITNQVDYATELANVPTTFAPSAHTHTLTDITDSGALAAQDNLTAAQITALGIPEPVSSTNQVAYATEISGLPTLGTLSAQDDLTAAQITALNIPAPVSATNQVAYATEISGLPTIPEAVSSTNQVAYATEISGLPTIPEPVSATNQVAYATEISGLPTIPEAISSTNQVDLTTEVTGVLPSANLPDISITDVEVFSTLAERNAARAAAWHPGDVAVVAGTDTMSYIYIGTDGNVGATVDADWQILHDAAGTVAANQITAGTMDDDVRFGNTNGPGTSIGLSFWAGNRAQFTNQLAQGLDSDTIYYYPGEQIT